MKIEILYIRMFMCRTYFDGYIYLFFSKFYIDIWSYSMFNFMI